MNRIESLIAELCPDGVIFKNLGDLITSNRGGGTPSRQNASFWNGDIKWASVGDITATSISIKETRQTITNLGLENSSSNLIPAGSVLIATKIAPGEMRVLESDIAINQDIRGVSLSEEIDPYFLVYFSKTIRVTGNGTIVKGITRATLDKIRVPVPPLRVQEEIVKILDGFKKLEAELEAELEARKKQYEYYRDQLLSFPASGGGSVRWATLSDVAVRVTSGATPTKSNKAYYENGTIPWLRTQDVTFGEIHHVDSFITDIAVEKTAAKWIPENCLIIAISGASAGRSAINKIPLTTNQHCCNIELNKKLINYKFAFYWVASKYSELKSLGRGARSDLNATIIKNFPIPIPPLSEQQRIVDILDKFDALTNDLTAGLPAEIEARRKQYEYYRDQLLTFKELSA